MHMVHFGNSACLVVEIAIKSGIQCIIVAE